ncbi:hypothetical protein [Halodesulfovibrio aestuarii]|uniref:Uncharacterized protein n=1 Tax=Halodesulfovibrio aestuarii TaxID=126333 RepID=A0ABV4JW53_9BACT
MTLRTIKNILLLSLLLVSCFATSVAAQQWCSESKEFQSSYVVEIKEDVLSFSFVLENGKRITENLKPVEVKKLSNGCFFAGGVVEDYFNNKFDVVLCPSGSSLVWAKVTPEEIYLIPNWLQLTTCNE